MLREGQYGFQLVAYAPMGDRIGLLPDFTSMTLTVPLGDLPTLTLSYPSSGTRSRYLRSGETEVSVEWTANGGDSWKEVPGARFLTSKTEIDLIEDGSTIYNVELVHIADYCQRALVWQAPKGGADKDGKWNFLSVTPGAIVKSVWDAARARGWGRALGLEGSAAKDAYDQAWKSIMTIAYDPSIDLWSVVTSLYDLGILDYQWEGRTLSLYNPDSYMSRNRENVIWRIPGSKGASETTTWQDMCTDVLVTGEGDKIWHFHNNEAPATLRRTEKTVSAGGVEKEATAKIVAERTLKSGAHPSQSVKREWALGASPLLPFYSFRPGDWIMVERLDGLEKMRVRQVSVTVDQDGTSGHVTLGSLLDDYLTRLAKKTKGIAGVSATSGSGVRPAKPADRRKPATPQGGLGSGFVIPNSNGYGYWAAARLSWGAVTTDARGVAIDISHYVVQAEREVQRAAKLGGAYWQRMAQVQFGESAGDYGDLDPGQRYRFRVYAVSQDGVGSEWSGYWYVDIPSDIEPPPEPSAPVLTQRQGVLSVAWDGAAKGGSSMPSDLSYLGVGVAGLDAGGVYRQMGTMTRTGRQCVIADLPLNKQLTVALMAVDEVGNMSGWGPSQTITLTQVGVDPAVIRNQVEEAIKNGEALSKATREEIMAAFAQMGRSNDIIESVWPPSRGTVGVSLWVSPDGRVFKCTKRGNKEE